MSDWRDCWCWAIERYVLPIDAEFSGASRSAPEWVREPSVLTLPAALHEVRGRRRFWRGINVGLRVVNVQTGQTIVL